METGYQFQGGPGVRKKAVDDGGLSRNMVGEFKKAWHLFDGAGSQLLYMMCGALAGTQLGNITRDLLALQGPVFGCSKSELVLGRLKEMENLLAGLQIQKNENDEISSAQVQMLCRCLLLFIKLQAEYHQMCSNTVSMVINHLAASSDCQENRDLLLQLKALELNKYVTSRQSPTRNSGQKKSAINTSLGSPKSQKHGSFKASLFSLFERKNSPEEGNSSFYVDIGQSVDETSLEAEKVTNEMKSRSQTMEKNQSDVLIHLGLDPNKSELSAAMKSTNQVEGELTKSANNTEPIKNGQVASQDELDSVINLLSGSSLNGQGMDTIPEVTDVEKRLKVQVQGSDQGTSAPSLAASDSLLSEAVGARNKSQRRSEGSIDLSGLTQPSHNTWPHLHRSSLPGGQLAMQTCYDFPGPTVPPPFNNGVRPAMTLPPVGAAHFQAYNLGFPDPKLNRAWPVSNLAGHGMETVSCAWSGTLDSDDMSDDSSVGDQFHMMSQYQHVDSSFLNREDPLVAFRRDDRAGDVKHHSLEDLLDGRSNTWPQQPQPWSHSSQALNLGDPNDQAHRPVTMQLSDPLTQRNFWMNPDGSVQTAQSQNTHGTGPL